MVFWIDDTEPLRLRKKTSPATVRKDDVQGLDSL